MTPQHPGPLVDDFLPVYDVSDTIAVRVRADAAMTWDALMSADLMMVGKRHPLSAVLGGIRMAPELISGLLHGRGTPDRPETLTLRGTTGSQAANGEWILLGERPDEEIALGLVGKFWRPVIEYASVGADEFRDFSEPGWAKTVYSLSVRSLEDELTSVGAVMRTAATDEHSRGWFLRYWTLGVGSGAHVLVNDLLEMVRDDAEERAGSAWRRTALV